MFPAGFIISLFFIFILELTFVIFLYNYWIKQNRLVLLEFNLWSETKKPYIWFFVWSFLIVLHVPLLILIYLVMYLTNLEWIFYIFILSIFIYPLSLGLIYSCVKKYLKDKNKVETYNKLKPENEDTNKQ